MAGIGRKLSREVKNFRSILQLEYDRADQDQAEKNHDLIRSQYGKEDRETQNYTPQSALDFLAFTALEAQKDNDAF